MSYLENFNNVLIQMNISLDNEKILKLEAFYNMLIEANSHTNLTAITEKSEVFVKHFADSLSIIRKTELLGLNRNIRLIDVGSGAGFPSIPLKIALPNLNITAVDSTNKKIQFINSCIERLGLKDIKAVHERAEVLSRGEYRDSFDLGVSRAVARLNMLSELILPLIKPQGYFVAYKAVSAYDEIEEARNAIKKLSADYISTDSFKTDSLGARCNIIIKKLSPTDKRYPRTGGKIKNSPII